MLSPIDTLINFSKYEASLNSHIMMMRDKDITATRVSFVVADDKLLVLYSISPLPPKLWHSRNTYKLENNPDERIVKFAEHMIKTQSFVSEEGSVENVLMFYDTVVWTHDTNIIDRFMPYGYLAPDNESVFFYSYTDQVIKSNLY